MSYAVYDFYESLDRAKIAPADVKHVHWAWGADDGSGSWSDSYFGFVMEMQDGRILYLTGWCDTSGWGCQDGADLHLWNTIRKPTSKDGDGSYFEEPDPDPIDLNKALEDGK